jgi:cholesterol transport system auxiliary component
MRCNKVLLILGASTLLMACSAFSPVKVEPTNTYVLSQTPTPAIKKTSRQMTVLVNYPQSSAVYNTTQMAYSTLPYEISYFSKNQWADTPSQMLQPLIAKTLQNTHYFRQVVTPGMLGRYDYILNTQLLQMQQVFFNHSSQMRMGLKAQIVNATSGQIIATKEFSVVEPAAPTPYGGVVAANRGVAKLLTQLVQFMEQSL